LNKNISIDFSCRVEFYGNFSLIQKAGHDDQ